MSEGIALSYNAGTNSYVIVGIGDCTESEIKLSSVYEGKRVERIQASAFEGCKQITRVEIDDGIKMIGEKAFYKCPNLLQVHLGKDVDAIHDYAFGTCMKLYEVRNASTIPLQAGKTGYGNIAQNAKKILTVEEEFSALETQDDFVYASEGEGYSLCGYVGDETRIALPTTHKDVAYTVDKRAFLNTGVDSVDISVGWSDFAFVDASKIKNIYYAGSLEDWCSVSFTEENAPLQAEGVTLYLKGAALSGGLEIDFDVADYALYGYTKITSVVLTPRCTSIGVGAFGKCSEVTSFVVQDGGLTKIPDKTLTGCEKLKTLTLGNRVTEIGEKAFYHCDVLETLTLPTSLQSVGASAFYYATTLTELTIPGNVKTVGDDAFAFSMGITKLTLCEGIEEIGAGAFNTVSGITELILPDSLLLLGDGAFRYCTKLAYLSVGDGLSTLPYDAFSKCPALEKAVWGTNIKLILTNAFGGDFNKDYEFCQYYYKGTAAEYTENAKQVWTGPHTDKVLISGIYDKHLKKDIPNTYSKQYRLYYYSETQPTAADFEALNETFTYTTPIGGGYWYYGENGKPVCWEKPN